MIVKKIPRRTTGRDAAGERAAHARNLVDYLARPEKESAERAYLIDYMLSQKLGDTSQERLFHQGARGFVSTTAEGQRAEMIALADGAGRSPHPVDHWLLSWREGERPTVDQIDESVAIFVRHLGVEHLPCIYACHGDTHNRHVHIALNRYDVKTGRMVEINGGFDREAAHQAVALIVDRFSWQAEAGARYRVVGGVLDHTDDARKRIEAEEISISNAARAYENRTGYHSAQRVAQHVAQEVAVPLIDAANSWQELHASLAAEGMTYERKGTNGGIVSVGTEKMRSSRIARRITPAALKKRLGEFVPRDESVIVVERDVQGRRDPRALRAEEYATERDTWRKWREGNKELRELGNRDPSTLTNTETSRKAALERRAKPPRPAPDLESWYYSKREGVLADRWRHRATMSELGAFAGIGRDNPATDRPPDGFHPFSCADGVRYARAEDGPTAFIDRGRRIDVIEESDAAMLAAFQLAAAKFGQVKITGTPQFRERSYALVVEAGLGHLLKDDDLSARFRKAQAGAEAIPGKERPSDSGLHALARQRGLRPSTGAKGPTQTPAIGWPSKGPTQASSSGSPGEERDTGR